MAWIHIAAAAAVRNDPAPDPDPEHCLQPEPEPPGESQTIVHPPAGTNWVNAGNFILTQADLDDAPGRYSKWIEDGFEEAMAAYPEGVALPPSVTKSPDGTQQFPRSYRSCYYRFSTGHIILKKRYIAPGSIKASFSDGGVDLSFQVVVFLQLDDLTIGVEFGTRIITAPDGTEIPDFTYSWDQSSYNVVTNECMNYIHFNVPGFGEIKKAFTYDWRLWSIAELCEILIEAGFSDAEVYIHGFNDRGESDETWRLRKNYENAEGWIAYVVGIR